MYKCQLEKKKKKGKIICAHSTADLHSVPPTKVRKRQNEKMTIKRTHAYFVLVYRFASTFFLSVH